MPDPTFSVTGLKPRGGADIKGLPGFTLEGATGVLRIGKGRAGVG